MSCAYCNFTLTLCSVLYYWHERKRLLLQFLHLQQDYEYNLELLDGRDAELERYDKEFDALGHQLAAKDSAISHMQARLAKADSGLHYYYLQASAPHFAHLRTAMKCRLIFCTSFYHVVNINSLVSTPNVWKYDCFLFRY